jgi:UDP-glucose 4-epimerase
MTLNLANGRSTSLLQLLELLNELLGTQVQPRFAAPRPSDVRHSLADITRAEKLLGYEPPVSFADGLRQSVEYYRKMVKSKV